MKNIFVILLLLPVASYTQNAATYISRGNEFYLQLQFEPAENQYRLALNKSANNAEAKYNLGNALMQQKKFKAAIEMYEEVMASDNNNLKAAAYYNAGVSYSKQKDLPNSIEAYKAALRINANDKEARENLQKALTELRQQQQQQNKQNKGGGGMDQKQADQKLKELQQKEKELQQKLQQGQGKGQGGGKDW